MAHHVIIKKENSKPSTIYLNLFDTIFSSECHNQYTFQRIKRNIRYKTNFIFIYFYIRFKSRIIVFSKLNIFIPIINKFNNCIVSLQLQMRSHCLPDIFAKYIERISDGVLKSNKRESSFLKTGLLFSK